MKRLARKTFWVQDHASEAVTNRLRRVFVLLALSLLAASMRAQPPSPDVVVLANDHLQLAFTHDGRLIGFTPALSHDNFLKTSRQPPPLVAVTIGNPDGSVQTEATPVSPRVSVAGHTALIESDSVRSPAGEIPVRIRIAVSLAPDSAESRWIVAINNRDRQRTVFAVTLPRISGVCLGPTADDDALYLPYWGGERFPHAIRDFADIAEHRLSPLEAGSNQHVLKQDGHYTRELTYAGGASMMWLDYVDAQHGLYVASYDPDFLVTVLHADTAAAASSKDSSMNFEFRKWLTVRPGRTATLAPFIVAGHAAAHANDWHWAADQYRAWFRTQVPLPPPADKCREQIGGWMPFLKNAYGKVGYPFSDVPSLWREEQKLGMDLIDPYGWSRGGFDSEDPEYYPDLDLGGPAAMARAWRQIRAEGGQIITYINARIFNRKSIYFPTLGEEAAARKPDGSYSVETYAPGSPESFAVMCPADTAWTQLLTDFGTTALTQYGSEIIYYDQVAASRPTPCYSTRHGHDGPGFWNQSYRAFLRHAFETDRKLNRNVAFMIEGAADLYAPYAFFQGYFCPRYAGTKFAFPELLKYTFPEIIQTNFFLNPRNSPQTVYPGIPTMPHDVAVHWLARDIMLGKLFVFMDPATDDHAWWQKVAALLAIRKAAAPWMANGVFRDTLDVRRAEPSLEAKTYQWRQPEKLSTLVAILNPDSREHAAISIVRNPALRNVRAFQLNPDGSRRTIPLTVENDQIAFTSGPDLLSMIVIEGSYRRQTQ